MCILSKCTGRLANLKYGRLGAQPHEVDEGTTHGATHIEDNKLPLIPWCWRHVNY